MGKRFFRLRQWSLRIICAVALLFVGLAHQPMLAAVGELTPFELAQYRLPDGSLPVLCVTYRGADGKEHGKTFAPGCELCRIVAAVILPSPPLQGAERLTAGLGKVVAPKAEVFRRQLYPPNSGPRAPPLPETLG
jgi:hypothetical protein